MRSVVAAFGTRAIRTAAAVADRMVINLVDPPTAGTPVAALAREAARLGRTPPPVAVWAPAAIDADRAALDQLRRGIVGYLAAPGYAEMFERAGFADVVALARTRPLSGRCARRPS
jgi:alkanesulfonate monooxygenase SsuD/methylene tetrahydromethanopterin reductase-like flavin-dependent oxidoreductase (luciferase family)